MEKAVKRYAPIFVLPTFLAFVIGFILPFIEGLYLSFCQFTTVKDAKFIGIGNYQRIFTDSTFTNSFKFTVLFAVASIVLINVIAFILALLLTRKLKGTNIFRTIFFMPNLIGGIVLGYIWQILINCVLSIVGKPLLALNTSAGYWGLIILMCWQQIGYMMIIYIAGLQNVSDDLIEAAQIDGATWSKTEPFHRDACSQYLPDLLCEGRSPMERTWTGKSSSVLCSGHCNLHDSAEGNTFQGGAAVDG